MTITRTRGKAAQGESPTAASYSTGNTHSKGSSVSLKDTRLPDLSSCTQQRYSKILCFMEPVFGEDEMGAFSLDPDIMTEAEPLIFKDGS